MICDKCKYMVYSDDEIYKGDVYCNKYYWNSLGIENEDKFQDETLWDDCRDFASKSINI